MPETRWLKDCYGPKAEGTNPPENRTKYMGDVVVSGQADTSVRVSWAILRDQWTGIGTINNEGELYVTYGTPQGVPPPMNPSGKTPGPLP